MTTLTDRPVTALLVIDVQNTVVAEAYHRDEVVAAIGGLVDRARAEDVPVIWVQHGDDNLVEGSDGWQLVPELTRRESEALVRKQFGDAFEDTDLEDVLAAARAGRVVVTGAETDACVRATIHGAFTRGYDVTLVADGHTGGDRTPWGAPPTEQIIAHTNLYWGYQAAPGRTADVAPAQDVVFDR